MGYCVLQCMETMIQEKSEPGLLTSCTEQSKAALALNLVTASSASLGEMIGQMSNLALCTMAFY